MDCMDDFHIKFDFLGKDSIRYENEVQVHPRVYELVKEFCQKDEKGNRESVTPPYREFLWKLVSHTWKHSCVYTSWSQSSI